MAKVRIASQTENTGLEGFTEVRSRDPKLRRLTCPEREWIGAEIHIKSRRCGVVVSVKGLEQNAASSIPG